MSSESHPDEAEDALPEAGGPGLCGQPLLVAVSSCPGCTESPAPRPGRALF